MARCNASEKVMTGGPAALEFAVELDGELCSAAMICALGTGSLVWAAARPATKKRRDWIKRDWIKRIPTVTALRTRGQLVPGVRILLSICVLHTETP